MIWFQLMDGYMLLRSHARRWYETCLISAYGWLCTSSVSCPKVAWDMLLIALLACYVHQPSMPCGGMRHALLVLIASLRVARAGCLFKLHGRSGPLGLATVLLAFYCPWWLAFYGPWWLAGSRLPPLPKGLNKFLIILWYLDTIYINLQVIIV